MAVKEFRLAAMFAAAAAAAAIVAAPIAAADTGEPDNPDITSNCFPIPDTTLSNCGTPENVDMNNAPDIQPVDQPISEPVDGTFSGPVDDHGGGDMAGGGSDGGGGHR
jgi:hypothetical protein